MVPARVTEVLLEILQRNPATRARTTEVLLEVLQRHPAPRARTTEVLLEVLQRNRWTAGRLTQLLLEVVAPKVPVALRVRASGVVLRANANALVFPFSSIFLLPQGGMVTEVLQETLQRNPKTRARVTQVMREVLVRRAS